MGSKKVGGGDAGNIFVEKPASLTLAENLTSAANDPSLSAVLARYGQYDRLDPYGGYTGPLDEKGGIDIVSQIQKMSEQGHFKGSAAAGAYREMAINPLSGTRWATEQVMNNPLLGQYYGKNTGALFRAMEEEKNLAKRGFSLKPEDYEAYGQASGNLARQFGESEANLAQALAQRGILQGGGPSERAYITQAGTKQEQLAQLQRQIADDRMRMNLERLNSTRDWLSTLGQGAMQAINEQYGRQLAGVNASHSQLFNTLSAAQRQQENQQEQANAQFAQRMTQKNQPSMLGAIGGSILGGVTSGIGSGIGGAIGGGIGSRIGNAINPPRPLMGNNAMYLPFGSSGYYS